MSNKQKDIANNSPKEQLPLAKQNYYMISAGFLLVVIGFFIMYVGKENRGVSDVIYSFGKTTVPVLFILLGFLITGVGIMKRFNK